MIRLLFILVVIFALGLGFAWLADRPGDMVVTLDGYQYTVSLMVAAVAVVAVVAAVMLVWWAIKGVWNSPQTVARYFRVRRRDRGYQALSSGMIAAGAGDGVEARRLKKQAMKLISSDSEPLLHLLDAQASLLEGDHATARQKFEAMLDDPEMRLLGLRGLYLEAERLGDRRAAYHYAGEAADLAPQLSWASDATLEARSGERDWDAALRLLDARKSTRQNEREATQRRRAVLLTAKAIDLLDSDPLAARNAATEANRAAPDLVPAAVIAAKALFKQGDLKKGSKILETAWKETAHPDIADAYVHARPGDSTHDRYARAKRLAALRQNNAIGELAVARAALDIGDFRAARTFALASTRISPSESAYLLLADIEEADGGDQGKIRQYLAKAVKAPPDAAWVADGVVSDKWAPMSPVTGRIDAFEWKVPHERLGGVIDQQDDDEQPLAIAETPMTAVAMEPVVELKASPPSDPKPLAVPVEKTPPLALTLPEPQQQPEPKADAAPAAVAAKPAKAEATVEAVTEQPISLAVTTEPDEAEAPDVVRKPEAVTAEHPIEPKNPPETAKVVVGEFGRGQANGQAAPYVVADDPGVDPDDANADTTPRRFRLF